MGTWSLATVRRQFPGLNFIYLRSHVEKTLLRNQPLHYPSYSASRGCLLQIEKAKKGEPATRSVPTIQFVLPEIRTGSHLSDQIRLPLPETGHTFPHLVDATTPA